MSNVAASNFTSLYSANASPVVPAMPYGDANVVALLNAGTVAGNTVGNIDAAGNITAGGEIAATGNITTDGFFVGNFAGNISGNIVVPGLNTQVLYNNNGNAGASAGFTFDSATNAAVVTGNVTAQYFVGNGSQLTGLPASYGNANVAGYLPTYTGNLAGGNAAIAGAVTAATVSTTGNIAANYFVGNGSLLTGISGSGDYSNANVQAYLPTYTGALTALTGNVTTTANISGNYILGNGSQLTGITATSDYGNANVSNYLNSGTNANNIVTTGNIAGNYFIGNGALLTGISAAYGNANVAAYLPTYTGNLEALTGNVTTTATLRGGNIRTAGFVSATGTVFANTFVGVSSDVSGNANVGNLTSFGSVSATGNITGDYILGNGSQLTGLPATYGNANVAAYLPTYTGNLSPGNITSTGNITGNITTGRITQSGSGSLVFTDAAGEARANIAAGNIIAVFNISATGNIISAETVSGALLSTGGNIVANGTPGTQGFITASSNITGANLRANTNITAGGAISAAGNITGNYFIGNGSLLTGVVAVGDYSNANVAAYLPTYTGNLAGGNANITGNITAAGITTTGVSGDISGVNTLTASNVIATSITAGNITANANVNAARVSATGNITGNYFIGNGSLLTGVSTSYNNSNVEAYLPTYTGNLSPGNVNATQLVSATNGRFSSSLNVGGGNIGSPDTVIINNGGITAGAGNIQTAGNIVFASTANGQSILGLNNLEVDGEVRATSLYAAGNISAPLSTISAGDLDLTGTITFMGPFGNVPRQVNFGYANIVGVENFQANSLATFADITATGNVIAREFVTANSCIMDDNFWTDGYIRVVPFGTTGAATADSQVQITPGLVDIGLRNRSAAGNSTIEFHTSTANIDYDSRIQASGGGSNAGEGIVTITAANTVMTGNVTGNYFIGNGSMLTGISGGGGDYGNANVAAYLPTYTGNLASLTGEVTTTANVTANYFIGDGSQLTGISGGNATPGGSNTQIQFNSAGAFAGDSALTFDPATDTLQIGNIQLNDRQIVNANDLVVSSGGSNGSIIIGNGIDGNISVDMDTSQNIRNARLAVWGSHEQGAGTFRAPAVSVSEAVTLTGNISGSNSRLGGLVSSVIVGGGESGYGITLNNPFSLYGIAATPQIGSSGNVNVGNTSVGMVTGVLSSPQVTNNSTATRVLGMVSAPFVAGADAVMTSVVGYTANPADGSGGAATSPDSYYVYHNPGATPTAEAGTINANLYRGAGEYYFLRNDDDAAAVKLGSLVSYSEGVSGIHYEASGNIVIDKNDGQVQEIYPTGNITITGFDNFVTSTSRGFPGSEIDKGQTDTVTLIVYGSESYTVTLPETGGDVKYAGGVSTLPPTTAEGSIVMISITAVVGWDSDQNFLVTISPEFT